MSYNVVIVPEDPTNNGYILKPLARAVLAACGKPNAKVSVLSNPRTSGYEHAKSLLRSELIKRYRHVDLLLFLPDADGKDRSAEFASLEAEAMASGTNLVCCAAQQEVETWLLAGHMNHIEATWQQVRSDASVKENFFQPFLELYGDTRRPGGGREDLMNMTLSNYAGFKARCPEIEPLEQRLSQSI